MRIRSCLIKITGRCFRIVSIPFSRSTTSAMHVRGNILEQKLWSYCDFAISRHFSNVFHTSQARRCSALLSSRSQFSIFAKSSVLGLDFVIFGFLFNIWSIIMQSFLFLNVSQFSLFLLRFQFFSQNPLITSDFVIFGLFSPFSLNLCWIFAFSSYFFNFSILIPTFPALNNLFFLSFLTECRDPQENLPKQPE